MATLSFVRPGGIGYLAVCASAQYALRVIAAGAPIDAFARPDAQVGLAVDAADAHFRTHLAGGPDGGSRAFP